MAEMAVGSVSDECFTHGVARYRKVLRPYEQQQSQRREQQRARGLDGSRSQWSFGQRECDHCEGGNLEESAGDHRYGELHRRRRAASLEGSEECGDTEAEPREQIRDERGDSQYSDGHYAILSAWAS